MADLTLILTGALGALALGGAAAQLNGPLASDWRARKGVLRRRLLAIATPVRLLGPGRRLAGAGALVAVLTAGGLTAYAAQPSAPERLAAQAAGVVGSGDQLALRLTQGGAERTIKPGEDYADGWKLDKLTPTSATLVKDGEQREVGLNPTGALASNAPVAPPSQVAVSQSDAELADRVISIGWWDGKTARPNLTLDETRRYWVLQLKGVTATDAYWRNVREEAKRAGYPGLGPVVLSFEMNTALGLSVLGAEAPEYIALLNKDDPSNPRSVADIKSPDEIALFQSPDMPKGAFVRANFWRQAAP